MTQTITLNKHNTPHDRNVDEDIDWLCNSLGLVAARDTHRISPQVLRFVISHEAGVTSDEIANALDIETQRVLYHLRSLINAGILVRQKRHIFLRQGSITGAVREIQNDADRMFQALLHVARDIDQEYNMKSRVR